MRYADYFGGGFGGCGRENGEVRCDYWGTRYGCKKQIGGQVFYSDDISRMILPAMTSIVPSDCILAGLFSRTGKSGLSRSS